MAKSISKANLIEVLRDLLLLVTHETDLPDSAANEVVTSDGIDEGVWSATKIISKAKLLLDAVDRQFVKCDVCGILCERTLYTGQFCSDMCRKAFYEIPYRG